jgi:hypothetical protein
VLGLRSQTIHVHQVCDISSCGLKNPLSTVHSIMLAAFPGGSSAWRGAHTYSGVQLRPHAQRDRDIPKSRRFWQMGV